MIQHKQSLKIFLKQNKKSIGSALRGDKFCELCVFPPRKEQQYIVILPMGFDYIK